MNFNSLPSQEIINKTIESLKKNGINALVVDTGEEAKQKVFTIIPEKSSVITMTSVTLDTIGISSKIQESGKYNSVKNRLMEMDSETQAREMQVIGSSPEWTIGSVHAITEDGKIIIASYTGSQLPAYAHGSPNVIWVVGAQKIVKDLDTAFKRIYDYVLPLESERVQKAYGMKESFVSKMLIINRELIKERLTVIFVKEVLGF